MTATTYRLSQPDLGWRYRFMLAIQDIMLGIAATEIWWILAWQDIKQRYRRSMIGPFWFTISTGVMVGGISLVYATLFNQPLGDYLIFVALGMIGWMFISMVATEACTVFSESDRLITQVNIPLTTHVMRMVMRNLIILAHNALLLVPILMWYGIPNLIDALSIIFVPIVFAINGLWLSLALGGICTRFRDVTQIVTNGIQMIFFVTPIMWKPELMANRAWIVDYNPFAHYIAILRDPLLGKGIPLFSWSVVLTITLIGCIACTFALTRYRQRLAYWL